MRKVNSKSKKTKKTDEDSGTMGKGCLIFTSILFIIVISVAAYVVYNVVNRTNRGEDPIKAIKESFVPPEPPERTTFLVVGLDREDMRTDTIMLMCINSKSETLDIVSIPRDTMVEIDGRTMKINAVNGYYGGDNEGMYGLEAILENMFAINIDYFIKIDCDAFEKIVDGIGGIDYDVPMRMYYNDPAQNLYIDLYPGMQHLNGVQAEGLVRFRKGYVRQDLDRVETQQDFIKVFLKTALSKDNILKNPAAYMETFFNDIETDFSVVTDFPSYASLFLNFSVNNVTGHTLEGEARYIYENGVNVSYFVADMSANRKLFYDIFKKETVETAEGIEEYDSRECSIQVLNGSTVNGAAGKTRDILENDGYNIAEIGNFEGEHTDDTLIYVNDEKYGHDLKGYFKNAEIIKDENVTAYNDIIIIVGTDDAIAMQD